MCLYHLSMTRRPRTYVCAVLLDGDSPFGRKHQRVNPDYVEGKPRVVIERLKSNPTIVYTDNNFEKSTSRIVREHGVQVLSEHSTNHTTRWGVVSSVDRISTEFRSQGWAVLNPNPPENRSVYVVELDDAISEATRVKQLNPDADPTLECLYVGQTSLQPQERFERHMRGHQASSDVKRFGIQLNMRFLRLVNPMTELESLREENSLAVHLRSRGHTVLGGH